MSRPPRFPLPPMEASSRSALPEGPVWQYEPKWDGFRCLAFREGDHIELQSKSCRPLGRYFPDVVEGLRQLSPRSFVLDGELMIPVDGVPSFEQLALRLHAAESRVRLLAQAHPARLITFDLLALDRCGLLERSLAERRRMLERFAARHGEAVDVLALSPATHDVDVAREWLGAAQPGRDGVIAKRVDLPYRPGSRDAMTKVKRLRTVDCVVGGFRLAGGDEGRVGSLLLGLYDDAGILHYVGFTAGIGDAERAELTRCLEASIEAPGFTGRGPDGERRRGGTRGGAWQPVRPALVVEVRYDHFAGARMRHGATLLRWRPEKSPRQCTLEQIAAARAPAQAAAGGADSDGLARRRRHSKPASNVAPSRPGTQ